METLSDVYSPVSPKDVRLRGAYCLFVFMSESSLSEWSLTSHTFDASSYFMRVHTQANGTNIFQVTFSSP